MKEFNFIPYWGSNGTLPRIGNGDLLGTLEAQEAPLQVLKIKLQIGSTTTMGTRAWEFKYFLPSKPALIVQNGYWLATFVGVADWGGRAEVIGDRVFCLPHVGDDWQVGANTPLNWSTGDSLVITLPVEQ